MTDGHATATPAAADIVSDSRWFPEALDAQNRTLSFVRTDRETIASRAFLSQSLWSNQDLPRRPLGLDTVANTVPQSRPEINFIWHTAYCSSTAISQALDLPGKNLSVREPDALTALARMKRGTSGTLGADTRRHLGALLSLLGRPFIDGEHVTIKPANAANCLIRDAAALTTGKMLFLYTDCRSFMISAARGGEARRAFVRRLFNELLADGHEQKSWPMPRLFEMSDLQIAALVWHMQIAEFLRSRPALGDRSASLDSDAFLAQPVQTLESLSRFFGYAFAPGHVEALVQGPLLRRHAKSTDEPFNVTARLAQQQELSAQMTRDLDEIMAWSYDVCRSTPRGVPLPDALVVPAKVYAP